MSQTSHLKYFLKRGALVAAANWQVVVIQFVADAVFKTMLVVPVVGGAFLVVLVAGGTPADLLRLEIRHLLPATLAALLVEPLALAAFVGALAIVLSGGSLLLFLVKGGTVTVLIAADRAAGNIEHRPLQVSSLAKAARFSLERFTAGARRLFGPYTRLGLGLTAAYGVSMAAYLLLVFGVNRQAEGWTLTAVVVSLLLVGWITIVNLLYLLCQIVIAVDGCPLVTAAARVARLVASETRRVGFTFAAVLALVVLTTAASILATAALGLIAFVPFVGLAALPLQLLAWILRGIVFQFIGLAGLAAYLRIYRLHRDPAGWLDKDAGPPLSRMGRTA